MNYETVALSSLMHDPSNVRKHDEKNLSAIKGSLAKFGQQKPIVVDANNIILAGNGTFDAAKSLGWESINIVRTELTGPEAIAYAIADNRTGELAEWDIGALGKELESLASAGFDLDSIGFDKADLEKMLPKIVGEGLTDDDAIPESVGTRCKVGDLWILGSHRLLCGDSTDIGCVERLMGGEKADMVFTDPPYGVSERTNRKSNGRGGFAEGDDFPPVIGDDSTATAIDAYRLCDGLGIPLIVFWGANYFCEALPQKSSWLVWDKREGKGQDDNADCELAWTNRGGPARIFAHLWKGAIKASEHGQSRVHPTQKPIALAEWSIVEYPKTKVEKVLDLFLGSGSTLIACEKTGRKCYGMELDPHYCDVILARWEQFTGKEAVLDGNRQTV